MAFIGLRNPDGSMITGVPLYVKVNEVNKGGVTAGQEELMHRISEIMIRRYEKQISEYFANLKKEGQVLPRGNYKEEGKIYEEQN